YLDQVCGTAASTRHHYLRMARCFLATCFGTGTSGSTGTEISGRDLSGKRPLHRLIDFTASELESYQKGCRKQQGWKPAKSRSFLQRFGPSEMISFLIDKSANALCLGQLVQLDSASLAPHR